MSDEDHIGDDIDPKKIIEIPAEELVDDSDIIDPLDPLSDSDEPVDSGELGDMDIITQYLDPYEEFDPNAR